jgi:ATP-dependent phosphofructokinase / diphosphate-dependent phosphofructokinase
MVRKGDHIRRVAMLFSGGPAPAANAVISAAATSYLDDGREVLGIFQGYEHIQHYDPRHFPLVPVTHYRHLALPDVTGIRNTQGVFLGTSRANPGKMVKCPADLDDPKKTALIRNCYQALVDLGVQGLISIGGDDTLKTANFLFEYQKHLPASAKRVRLVHLPKTIDNDYEGIDFTFGYFTAVDVMAKELKNLRADAAATSSYFIVESMGRKAGWLSYGVGIAGEANLMISVEDLDDHMFLEEEVMDPETGITTRERRCRIDLIVEQIVNMMVSREQHENKHFGVVVLAEGLGEVLPERYVHGLPLDEHGHISIGKLDLGKLVARLVADEYQRRTGREKKVTGLQFGYEARCAIPHAFDVMLGSQLGIGAYRALVEEGLDGHMVSVAGQLDLHYVPFQRLVDPATLRTQVRFIRPGSDFHRLARFLETRVERVRSESSPQNLTPPPVPPVSPVPPSTVPPPIPTPAAPSRARS